MGKKHGVYGVFQNYWMLIGLVGIGLQNVHFENYCSDCRGWNVKTFKVEMVAPNYMNISAYPLAMSKSTDSIVSGEIIHIENFDDMSCLKPEAPEFSPFTQLTEKKDKIAIT